MELIESLKEAIRLKAFNFVLQKVDTDKIAGYLDEYGANTFPRGRKDFMNMTYHKLLEIVSAVNRRR